MTKDANLKFASKIHCKMRKTCISNILVFTFNPCRTCLGNMKVYVSCMKKDITTSEIEMFDINPLKFILYSVMYIYQLYNLNHNTFYLDWD